MTVRFLWIIAKTLPHSAFQLTLFAAMRIFTNGYFRKILVRRGFATVLTSRENVKKFCLIQKAGIFVAAN